MMNSEPKRLCGRYLAENKDDFLSAYHIVVDVNETDKSYIMQLVEFNSRYSASHISLLFSKSKRVLLSKKKGGFAIKNWGDIILFLTASICRFSKVFNRVPFITEEDGCTEFVIRSTY